MPVWLGTVEEVDELVPEMNLLKNVFYSFDLSRLPSFQSCFCLESVFFMPLILFCWRLISSFFLYFSLLS